MNETYRDPARAAETVPPAPTHTCRLVDGDSRRWMRLIYVKALLTVAACAAASVNGASGWTLLALAAGLYWMRGDWRDRQSPGIVFRVANGRLSVSRPDAADIDVRLERLHDVRLDTKASSRDLTISRSDGVNSAFGMSSAHSIEFDVSRIELVTAGEVRLLAPEFISNSRCTEEMGKLRRFLRSHGWRPLAERAPAAGAKAASPARA